MTRTISRILALACLAAVGCAERPLPAVAGRPQGVHLTPSSGHVTAVRGRELTIDLGAEDGIQVEM